MKWFLPFGLILLVSCQTTGGTFCDLSSPIRLSPEQIEQLTDEQVRQFLGHNERGRAMCDWQP